jgi:hypothetical protein
MNFPGYVPNSVRERMTTLLEGDSNGRGGLISALAKAKAQVLQLPQLELSPQGKAKTDALRIKRAKAITHRDSLTADFVCCQRLLNDPRMKEAYGFLVGMPNVTDDQMSGFIYAAWAARIDYGKFRKQMAAAAGLAKKVAEAAEVLAGLLKKAESTRGLEYHLAHELFDLHSLLEKTDHDPEDRNFHMWPGMRPFLLGESPGDHEPSAEAARRKLRHAWSYAPSIAHLTATLARETSAFAPAESGSIGKALSSRKGNRKVEYLRAFGYSLRAEHRVELGPNAMNAMAITATVVLDDPGLFATYDDVRKALTTSVI